MTRIERNYENTKDDEERQECNEDYYRSCYTIDYFEEKSNDGSKDYNKRRYVATNYGEKRRETNKDCKRNYERDYCYYKRKPERNKDHKRRISNKNDDIVTKKSADYSEESNKRNLKYYKRKIVEDRKKSRLLEPVKSEDDNDERKSLTPIRKRPILIKSLTDSCIDASDKNEDYLKLTPKQMKSKKQRVTIQCKNDEEKDEVIQRKYKRTENAKIKRK